MQNCFYQVTAGVLIFLETNMAFQVNTKFLFLGDYTPSANFGAQRIECTGVYVFQ